MSFAIRLLFLVGLVSAIPARIDDDKEFKESITYNDKKEYKRFFVLGLTRRENNEKGHPENERQARDILQTLEILGSKYETPRHITRKNANYSGLLHLTKEELDYMSGLVKNMYATFANQVQNIANRGAKRERAGGKRNIELRPLARQVLKQYHAYKNPKTFDDSKHFTNGEMKKSKLVYLSKLELTVMLRTLKKLTAIRKMHLQVD